MRPERKWVIATLVLSEMGCKASNGTNTDAASDHALEGGTTTGSGGNTTTGSGGNTTTGSGGSIATGSGGNTATGSGGNTTTGSGGQSGAGGGGTTTSCSPRQHKMSGMLAGKAIALDLFGVAGDSGTRSWLMPGIADGGELWALHSVESSMFSPLSGVATEGVQQPFYGVLAMPRSPAGDGSIYCIGGRTALAAKGAVVTVDRGSLLGQCPGVAVAGELDFCISAMGACRKLTGTLDGVSIQLTGFRSNGTFNEIMVHDATLVARLRAGAEVTNGLIWSPDNGPLAGGVYCIGGGMCTSETVDGGPETITRCTLSQFTKVGTCSAVPDPAASAAGCIRGAS